MKMNLLGNTFSDKLVVSPEELKDNSEMTH